MTHRAQPCPCGDKTCKKWIVDGSADFRLPEAEAKAVASLLNAMDDENTKPVGYTYELAGAINTETREYCDWRAKLTYDAPNVPEGGVRNLRALYAHPPAHVDFAQDRVVIFVR